MTPELLTGGSLNPSAGQAYFAPEPVFVNSKGERCDERDPDVTTQVVAKGGSIPLAQAVALGLIGEGEPPPDPRLAERDAEIARLKKQLAAAQKPRP